MITPHLIAIGSEDGRARALRLLKSCHGAGGGEYSTDAKDTQGAQNCERCAAIRSEFGADGSKTATAPSLASRGISDLGLNYLAAAGIDSGAGNHVVSIIRAASFASTWGRMSRWKAVASVLYSYWQFGARLFGK